MFALDLFNTDHERRLAEGAVDQLEQRRIDDLAMRMDDLVARAKKADTPEARAALVKEFQKCKDERDSYFKIKDQGVAEGGDADRYYDKQEPGWRDTPDEWADKQEPGWRDTPDEWADKQEVEQGMAEGRPEDLPGIDYDRPGDRPHKKSSREHNPYPFSKEEDDDYFREIFRKKREAKAKEQGELEEDIGPQQKAVGQLGATAKVNAGGTVLGNPERSQRGLRGKLVGTSESVDPLARIIKLSK